ncbi:MAG TPA: heavy metal-associated domain-containing protein [Flavobacteriaceae bacterium]|nr:heavy metal-associated domain-containing protein [Flavobacteriaceae bacterium]
MKSILTTCILVLFSVANINAQEKTNDQFTVEINGMGCPYCASGVEDQFSKLDHISDIKIDIKTGTLTFDFPTTENLALEDVKKRVKAAGYTLSFAKVERANGTVETLEKEKTKGKSRKK